MPRGLFFAVLLVVAEYRVGCDCGDSPAASNDAGVFEARDAGVNDAGADRGDAAVMVDAGVAFVADAGADAGFEDAGSADAGPPPDAGVVPSDAGPPDAGANDSGTVDGGAGDAGAGDAGSTCLNEGQACAGAGCCNEPVNCCASNGPRSSWKCLKGDALPPGYLCLN